ncbi:MAG: TIGR03545 family protein [Halofilum sp. (in: g-proteobacteria)]|nr:TIGR03545 family protein [Halofilum sp. (in: g-proteobacteria)]
MKRIRWWGLAVFVVLVGGTVTLWLVFADTLVRRAIEATGTRMVGARVELAAAEVGFSPARLELRGLAVTDADAPMRNALEAERIAFDIDWLGLLLDRVQVDEVAVEGLRFGTERASSGAVLRTRGAVRDSRLLAAARERLELPPLEVPPVATVLEREGLESPAVIAQSQRTIRERRAALETRLAELPGSEELADYRRRLDAATGGDSTKERLRGLKQLGELAEELDDDLERLRRARTEARAAVATARQAADAARRAPAADIDRLYRKYTDPGAVAGELAHYLLGPKVAGWVNRGWYWYGRLAPYLGGAGDADSAAQSVPAMRRPGRVVVFPQAVAEPRVLVRRVRISGGGEGGTLDGRVTDIAVPASLWAEPLRARLDGRGLAGLQGLALDAGVDRRRPGHARARIDLDAAGAEITGLALGADAAVRADRGRADFRVAGTVDDGALDLSLQATLDGLDFAAGEGAEPVLREVAAALSEAGRIELGARIGGTVEAPELQLTSSLRPLLEPLLRNRLQQAAGGFRDGLGSAVRERTAGELDELETSLEELRAFEQELEQRLQGFERTLERVKRQRG